MKFYKSTSNYVMTSSNFSVVIKPATFTMKMKLGCFVTLRHNTLAFIGEAGVDGKKSNI